MSETVKERTAAPNFALPWTIANDHREHVDIIDARGKSVFEQIRADYAALIVKAVNSFPKLIEALKLIAGGFEGEGLEIENQWRIEVARTALSSAAVGEDTGEGR